jgi:hypothetical protein
MAAQIDLSHRFDPGSVVTLVRVREERTLRAEGGEAIDRQRADKQGTVTFGHRSESCRAR